MKQGEQLGMYEVASATKLHKDFDPRAALVIPYFNLDGRPMKRHPSHPEFYRIRYLAKGTGFADLAGDKEQRYAQEPHSPVCAYFPLSRPWPEIARDPKQSIIITEGELKAAAACALEFNCIGLGGVWNFRSYKSGTMFLPELEQIDWVRRRVYICYDSDYVEKPQVCNAINALAEELVSKGAFVFVTLLDNLDDKKKIGLDDYFLECTSEDFHDLMRASPALGVTGPLWAMNEELVYVNDPGMVVHLETGQKIQPGAFKEHSKWATANAIEATVDGKGNLQYERVSAAPLWIKWPLRRYVKKMTYAPGQPRITEDNMLNGWEGWGAKPRKGDVKPFMGLFNFIFQDLDDEQQAWVLDWMAYPIQHPGTKMFAAVVVHGLAQGTGKSLIGYTLGDIYGANFKEIRDNDIEGGQTWWAENRQFVMADEITGNDSRQHAAQLKRMITQEELTINIKYVPQYTVPDCINYYFTAQHVDSFFLEDADRRYFINEVRSQPLEGKFYTRYDRWRKDEGGPDFLMHWLLERKITRGFNPYAPPPDTFAKRRMILAGKGDLARWVHDMIERPAEVLVSGQMRHARDLFTANELLSMYKVQFPEAKITVTGMARTLSNAGCPQVADGSPLRGPEGSMARYYAVRNRDRWAKATDRKKMESNIAMPPVRRTK